VAAQSITALAGRLGVATLRTATTEAEALARLGEQPAELVLVDTALCRPDTAGFTRRVLSRAPGAVLLLFGTEEPLVARAAVAAGARGLIRTEEPEPVATVTKALLLLGAPRRPANAVPAAGAGSAAGGGGAPVAGGTAAPPGTAAGGTASPGTRPGGAGPGGTAPPGAGPGGQNPGAAGRPGQSGPGQSGPGQSGPGQSGPGQSGPGQTGPGRAGPGGAGSSGAPAGARPPALDPGAAAAAGAGMVLVPAQRGDLPPAGPAWPASLTERELQVLRGMAEGKSNAEIGRDLFVSEDTVKTHARRLFRKLRARDRAHAVAVGFRAGTLS
jgi:DNA-binding NarL/FixJ family response regulator